MRNAKFFFLSLFIGLFSSLPSAAQSKSQAYLNYIEKYSPWAVDQMNRYRIPASITLAQGLLESRAGQSRLAVKANNHFGIKVGSTWKGPYIREDDDAPQEKFRKYSSARESYEDHSKFLTGSQRYASLFSLKITDYKGWARGLKRCGYATSPTYAQSLIRIIEMYGLDAYDKGGKNLASSKSKITTKAHTIFKNNKRKYVIVEADDDLKAIAAECGLTVYQLRKYNELPKDYTVQEGDMLYLSMKRRKAEKKFAGYQHIIQAGESMYTIAQQYGIQLKYLYQLNGKSLEYAAQPGDIIWVR